MSERRGAKVPALRSDAGATREGTAPEGAPQRAGDTASAAAGRPGVLDPDSPVSAAWNALAGVYDPELYLDVVSLGLVYDVRMNDGALIVEMTMTTPGCPVSETLPEEAKAAVRQATADGYPVDVRVVWDPPWDPSMMDDAASSTLGFSGR